VTHLSDVRAGVDRIVTRAAGPTPRRVHAGFAVAVAATVVMMAGASAPSPFYPGLQTSLGLAPWVMTAVFAVYALALLVTLLVFGSVSDHVGRRPVVTVGFLLLAGSFALFWHADAVNLLVAARVLQGVASGLLLSTLSTVVTDLEPPNRPGLAALANGVAPMAGLAVGALVAGAVLDLTGAALRDVFGGLTALALLLAVGVRLVPETAPRRAGLLASLRPRVAIPPPIRGLLARSAPAIVAGWATGGLFLSLGAAVVRTRFDGAGHLVQGLTVALLAGAGALAVLVSNRYGARAVTIYGTAALSVGTLLTLAGLAVGSEPAYLAAVVVTGTGFGTAFAGILRSVVPLLRPDERAEAFAVVYVVSYLAFGIPAVVAGLVTPSAGLLATTSAYGVVVALLAATAAVLRWRSRG
jgi:predicted MFS family arabinose efflux permease